MIVYEINDIIVISKDSKKEVPHFISTKMLICSFGKSYK